MRTLPTIAAWLLVAGCATGAAGPAEPTVAPTHGDAVQASEDTAGVTVAGTLGGDAALEGGCVWVDTAEGRIEVLWPEGYAVSAEPVELRDPDGGVVATAGDRVEISGAPATDRVSTCQVGEIWQATAVRAG